MKTRLLVFIIIIFLLIDLAILYPTLTGKSVSEIELKEINVTRVIDGDTFEVETGQGIEKIRLRGLNTPERNQRYYEEAKVFLEQFENRTLELEDFGEDKYKRTLGYVYYNGHLINKKILEKGLGNLYYYGEDRHKDEMEKSEEEAREKGVGLWKKSENYGCVEIVDFDYISKGGEEIVLNNKCSKIKATLKDDATHIYNIELDNGIWKKDFNKIWNDNGDSVYLWDESGLLLFYRY